MAVLVKRNGVRLIATLPQGEWTLKNWRGRIVAFSPGHPPLIVGEDGVEPMNLSADENRQLFVQLDRFGNVAG